MSDQPASNRGVLQPIERLPLPEGLEWKGTLLTVIDFPQMISSSHRNAAEQFERDRRCIIDYFTRRFGVKFETDDGEEESEEEEEGQEGEEEGEEEKEGGDEQHKQKEEKKEESEHSLHSHSHLHHSASHPDAVFAPSFEWLMEQKRKGSDSSSSAARTTTTTSSSAAYSTPDSLTPPTPVPLDKIVEASGFKTSENEQLLKAYAAEKAEEGGDKEEEEEEEGDAEGEESEEGEEGAETEEEGEEKDEEEDIRDKRAQIGLPTRKRKRNHKFDEHTVRSKLLAEERRAEQRHKLSIRNVNKLKKDKKKLQLRSAQRDILDAL